MEITKSETLSDRITLYKGDITSKFGLSLLNGDFLTPNVVVFNNVFQFFTSSDGKNEVKRIWNLIRDNLTKNTILVAIPALDIQFEEAGISNSDINLALWVKEVEYPQSQLDMFTLMYSLNEDESEDVKQVKVYSII